MKKWIIAPLALAFIVGGFGCAGKSADSAVTEAPSEQDVSEAADSGEAKIEEKAAEKKAEMKEPEAAKEEAKKEESK